MKKINSSYIEEQLNNLYPNAKCELNHSSHFELLCAVALSAQTTDARVNVVTRELFQKYPNAKSLADAKVEDVERIIKSVGMYHNKAENLINMAKVLNDNFKGEVPSTRSELLMLPGVGRKTANVILSNCFDYPAFAVDTHVSRVSKRLRLAYKDDDVLTIEKKLMKSFPKEHWCKLHHQFIFFGRYKCKAIKPECDNCPFVGLCRKTI